MKNSMKMFALLALMAGSSVVAMQKEIAGRQVVFDSRKLKRSEKKPEIVGIVVGADKIRLKMPDLRLYAPITAPGNVALVQIHFDKDNGQVLSVKYLKSVPANYDLSQEKEE